MAPAKINFLSPKGYGMATTEDGSLVFLPCWIIQENNLQLEEEIEVETEPGEKDGEVRAKAVKRPSVPEKPPGKTDQAEPQEQPAPAPAATS